VVISSPDVALAQRIAGSLRRTPVDFAGCAGQPTQLDAPRLRTPQRDRADRLLAPGNPVAAGVCRYESGWLVRSTSITGAQATALAGTLNGLPHGTSRLAPGTYSESICPEEAGNAVLVHFSYRDGPPLTVWTRLEGCGDLGASNGTVRARRGNALRQPMGRLVGTNFWPNVIDRP